MTIQRSSIHGILAVFLILALGGCGLFSPSEYDETRTWSVQKLYAEAPELIIPSLRPR